MRRSADHGRKFYKRANTAWVQDVRANYVCIHNGDLAATVFSNEWIPWQVIYHVRGQAHSLLLLGEQFDDPFAAMSRAEEIISGSEARLGLGGLPSFWRPGH